MHIKLKNMHKANNDIDDNIDNGINHSELKYNYKTLQIW